MTMDLDWLRDFIALAEHGNFSRAADARHVTQPAFSRRVRALEDWIGTPLFTRSAQGTTLTDAGHAFHPEALDLVASLDRARRTSLAAAEHQTATLAIAATHALSFTFFPGWIGQHIDIGSLGKLNLLSDTMEACEQSMLSGEVHFLLCHWREGMKANLNRDKYASLAVGRDVLIPVSARDEQGHAKWPAQGKFQLPTRLLGYSPSSGLGRILASVSSHPINGETSKTVFTSHLAATLLAMARDGKGVAWLPLSLVRDALRREELVRAGPEDFDVAIEIRLFRSPECRNRAADALWEKLASTQPTCMPTA